MSEKIPTPEKKSFMSKHGDWMKKEGAAVAMGGISGYAAMGLMSALMIANPASLILAAIGGALTGYGLTKNGTLNKIAYGSKSTS